MSVLHVVPSERHVERIARAGRRGETRAALRARLAAALCPDVRFADVREARLTLAVALSEVVGQLDLFAEAGLSPSLGPPWTPSGKAGLRPQRAGGGVAADDPLLASLRGRGGASWVRAVSAIDEAIGALRAQGVTDAQLDRAAQRDRVGAAHARRAHAIAAAMRALDGALARASARDGRLVGTMIAERIRAAGADPLRDILGATRVRARWLLAWDPADLAWWRALDETLILVRGPPDDAAPDDAAPGEARIVMPSFDQPLDGARRDGPLEVLAEIVARGLDAAPETETIAPVLGDFAAAPPLASRVRLARAGNARDEARLVARVVGEALDAGARVERVAIAYPARDERVLGPLRRALDDAGIVWFDAIGPPPSGVPVVAAALHALAAAESLERTAVARVLRSGYVDAPRALGDPALPIRDAERVLARLARALETRAAVAGADEADRLVKTAAASPDDRPAAERIAAILVSARAARTRGARVRAARALFHDLGFAARAGRGARGTFMRDEAPRGVDRAERVAVARDVRAWEVLESALDAYEAIPTTSPALDAEVFRLELTDLLDASAPSPGAGRAGAVRIARLSDVAGDELDLLVVLEANDGVLPRDVAPPTLVSEPLEDVLARPRGAERRAGEVAARDLASLAVAAAESNQIVLVTTTEDASPCRLFVSLERSGCPLVSPWHVHVHVHVHDLPRRVARERQRESFFLDPTRPRSDAVGDITVTDAILPILTQATGASPTHPLAVTAIERFAQCPFKGYAHVVLGAREPEEQRELPDAREEGNLGHSALAAAFVATREAWPSRPRTPAEILARGLAAADAALGAAAEHAPLRAITRLRIRESVRAVLARAIDDETWDFILAEQAFGGSAAAAWPAFEAGDGSGRLWLRGSIDRVDRAHAPSGGARVIDYKRSKSTVRSSTASLGETALQVPVYAAVAARRLESPSTGAYLPMQPRDLATETRARSSPEDRVAELARRTPGGGSEIERRVLAIAAGARAGRFAPIPAREAECTHCGASGGCRKPRFAMAPDEDEEAP